MKFFAAVSLVILVCIHSVSILHAQGLAGKGFSCRNYNLKDVDVLDENTGFITQTPGFCDIKGTFLSDTELTLNINLRVHSTIEYIDWVKCNLTNTSVTLKKVAGTNDWKAEGISLQIDPKGTVDNLQYDYPAVLTSSDGGSCHLAVDSMQIHGANLSWLDLLL